MRLELDCQGVKWLPTGVKCCNSEGVSCSEGVK